MDTTVAKVFPGGRADDAVAEPIAGRYRIRRRLGRGRLGEIYEASDERNESFGVERHVAIQLLPDSIGFSEVAYGRLKTGYGELLARPHPNLVEYHDIGRDKRFGYIVMERLEGASLRKILDLEKTLPLSDVAPVVTAIGGALEFLHGKSIAHGNVSPRNVFVTDDLEFRLLDVVPIPAPESGPGRTIATGIADDRYDLACLAYQMLAGKHPYNFRDRANAARSGVVPDRIESLPEREWRALEQALSFSGARKPATIAAFLREFGAGRSERQRRSSTPGTSAVTRPSPEALRETDAVTLPVDPAATSEEPEPVRAGNAGRRAERPSETGSLLLLISLVALGAWTIAGQPQQNVESVLETIGPSVTAPATPVPLPEATPAATVATNPAVGNVGTAPETSDAASPPRTEPARTEPVTAASAAESADPGSAPGDSAPAFDASFVTVSEGDAAARLSIQLPQDASGAYSWWTRPHGAQAEEDFVAVNAQPVRAEGDDGIATLLVPLVNDGRPEPLEDFFIHIGSRDAAGRLVPADTIRVDIVDDD